MQRFLICAVFAVLAGCAPRHLTPRIESLPDCSTGGDDTATIQAAITAGVCLPAGVYNVDAPPLVNGRRRDSMLPLPGNTGQILCGARADRTTIRFRGDAYAMYWAGYTLPNHGTIHDVTLDGSCLVNTVEQTHLVRAVINTDATTVRDAVLIHPHRDTKAGDCINVVGSMTAPNHGMMISHVHFQGCARVGVQISRGLVDGVITDSTFTDCAIDIGSEGAGVITNLEIAYNHFELSVPQGWSLELERQEGTHVHHNVSDGRPVLVYFTNGARFDHNTFTNVEPGMPVVDVADTAHDMASVSDTFHQTVDQPVWLIAPLRTNRQADLGGISAAGMRLQQAGTSDFIQLSGVTGFTLTSALEEYTGQARVPVSILSAASGGVPPAISVLTTGVVETDTGHLGF